jgi:hypothetical protein
MLFLKDDTPKVVTEYMQPLPGKLYEEPFVDYGATRNRILVLCKQNANPIFTLMLSADEAIKNPKRKYFNILSCDNIQQ